MKVFFKRVVSQSLFLKGLAFNKKNLMNTVYKSDKKENLSLIYQQKSQDFKTIALYHIKMKCLALRKIAFLKVKGSEHEKLTRLEEDYHFHNREFEKYRQLFRNTKLLI